jgi:methylthioribose-1-phosphate isomerase
MLVETVDFREGTVRIIDQTLLPEEYRVLELTTPEEVAEAISSLRVRGAPAIGIAAAYGVLLGLDIRIRERALNPPRYIFDREEGVLEFEPGSLSAEELIEAAADTGAMLAETRPTAVNLFWAVRSMSEAVEEAAGRSSRLAAEKAAEKAFAIHDRELQSEYSIGEYGSKYIRDGMNILTHCNAGGLATAGFGTALALIYHAHREGKKLTVYADETRPLLQGARLTAWELNRQGIEVRVLCDGAAASLIASSGVDCVIVGADRIAANGDTANKIGTLGLAVLCGEFGIPFYVAAPLSTFDLSLESGEEIDIERRCDEEVSVIAGRRIAPEGVNIHNPAFDVTPARYITAIVTDRGVIERPDRAAVRFLMEG